MCTVGYHKELNIIFKNRDKCIPTDEVVTLNPEFLAVKTEGADYFSAGINKHSCAFASTAVNTPEWTAKASEGKMDEASVQFKKENEGLVSPMIYVSEYLPKVTDTDKWLEKVLNSGKHFMGYNLLLCDKEKTVHVELYKNEHHITEISGCAVISNHFRNLDHGPKKCEDYPNSFERYNAIENCIENIITLEDVFNTLKPLHGNKENIFWRTGNFFTVSSSVFDLDTYALYYTSSPTEEYSRVSGRIPPKGAEKTFIEMSRYIDLPTYHKIERGHPFYEEMLTEINFQIEEYHKESGGGERRFKALEIGAGTGLCSLELVKHQFLDLDCLDLDNECCNILKEYPESSNFNVINGDAITYCKPHEYDLLVSTFAHDHIHYDKRFAFARNLFHNMKKGGRYVIGMEVLPYFSTEDDRKKALFKYHNYIIELALRDDRVQLSELENNALKSGLDMVGDFKRHEAMLEEEMESSGFKIVSKKKLGPFNKDGVGGVYVYVFEA
jgi:hypothetical protein